MVLTQRQECARKGDRLVIDLKTGESRFENTGNTAAGGRIRALFMLKAKDGAEDAKSGDAKSARSQAGRCGVWRHDGHARRRRGGSRSLTRTHSEKAERDDNWTSQDPFIPEMRP